jgi:NAD(P)-dependent dehydrogenase (short-subunit alcohol dehydrogenase family)
VLVPGDLEDPAVPAEVVNSSAEHLGGLDALVMSHAESVDSGILDTTVESFDRHYTVNVRATWLLIAAFAKTTAGDRWIGGSADQRPHRGEPSLRRHQGRPRSAGARIGPMNPPIRVLEPTSSTQDRSTPAG